MRIMTLRQPWAWLVVEGWKDVENRDYSTSHRGRIAIHAGKVNDDQWADRYPDYTPPPPYVPGMDTGAIVGVVSLVDVVRDNRSKWAEADAFHWVLADAHRFAEPIPFVGTQGLRHLDDETTKLIERLLATGGTR